MPKITQNVLKEASSQWWWCRAQFSWVMNAHSLMFIFSHYVSIIFSLTQITLYNASLSLSLFFFFLFFYILFYFCTNQLGMFIHSQASTFWRCLKILFFSNNNSAFFATTLSKPSALTFYLTKPDESEIDCHSIFKVNFCFLFLEFFLLLFFFFFSCSKLLMAIMNFHFSQWFFARDREREYFYNFCLFYNRCC